MKAKEERLKLHQKHF